MLDITIPLFIGRVVTLVSAHPAGAVCSPRPGWQLRRRWRWCCWWCGRRRMLAQNIVTNQMINPGVTNMIRWQNHWHVVRQSWTFFQNDFAGRIANRVIQTGPALRESIVAGDQRRLVHPGLRHQRASRCCSAADWRLAIPIHRAGSPAMRCCCEAFVPRMRERSRAVSEARSTLTGRVVDSYTNILTVKLFARARDEDAFVRDAVDSHTAAFRRQTRMATGFTFSLALMNAALVVGTGLLAILLFRAGHIAVGTVATALPMAWQIANMAGWVAQNVTGIFENVGIVQDGMRSIAVPRQMPDPPGARELVGHRRGDPLRECLFRLRRATGGCRCCTRSTSPSRRASGSAWSARRGRASRRW